MNIFGLAFLLFIAFRRFMPRQTLDTSRSVVGSLPQANNKPPWARWLASLPCTHAPRRLVSRVPWNKSPLFLYPHCQLYPFSFHLIRVLHVYRDGGNFVAKRKALTVVRTDLQGAIEVNVDLVIQHDDLAHEGVDQDQRLLQ